MSEPSRDEIFAALRAADAAGDAEAAGRLSAMYREYNYQRPVNTVDVPASDYPPGEDYRKGMVLEGDTLRQPTNLERAGNVGKFIAGSIGRLGGGLALGASDFMSGDPLGVDAELLKDGPEKEAMLRSREGVRNFLPDLMGIKPPSTPGERIADSLIQGTSLGFGGGAALARSGGAQKLESLAQAIRPGVIAGSSSLLGQSTAEQVGPSTTAGQIARAVGSLGGGLAATGAFELTPRPLRDSLRDTITPEMSNPLRQAGAAAREAQQSGVSSNLLDHYPGPDTRLHDIQQALVLGGGANRISDNIRAQGPQVAKLANDTIDALPGNIVTKQTVANTVGRASTGLQKDMQKQATADFDTALTAVKAKQVGDAQGAVSATGAELDARRQDMATSAEGGGRMMEEDRTAALAKAKDGERLAQLSAGREVSNSTGFNIDELGNYGTMLAARRVREGADPRASYSAQDLLDAGLTSQEVRALVAKRQPVTQGTGTMQGDYSPESPGQVGAAGEKIVQRGQKDYLDAAEAHEATVANLAGIDRLPPTAIAETQAKIDQMISDQRGNAGMVADLEAIRNGFGDLQTSKELQNFIVSVRHDLPSSKLNSHPADISEGSVLGAAIAPLKDLRNSVTPGYAAADNAYKSAKDQIAETHDKTDIGKLTPKSGTYTDGEASAGAVYNLLKGGESPKATDGRLRKTLTLLGRKDPEGLQNTVKSYLDQVLSDTFGKGRTGKPNARPGEQLTSALGSATEPQNAAQMNGLRIALDAVADTSKMSISERQALHRGVDHLREIANANARTARNPTSMTRQELDELMQEPRALAALNLIGISPGKNFLSWVKTRMNRSTAKKLDELLSNPSASNVESLIELGKAPKISRRQSALLASMAGYIVTDAPPTDKPPVK